MENCCTIFYFLDSIFNSITFAAITAGLLAGSFAFGQYKRQKTWQNIDERYFKDGIEDLLNYLNNIRLSIEQNYDTALKISLYLKVLKDKHFQDWFKKLGPDLNMKAISSSMPKSFLITAQFLDSKNFGNLCIDLFVDCDSVNDFFVSEIPLILKDFIEKPTLSETKKRKLAKYLKDTAVKEYDKIFKKTRLYDVIEILENILFRLRKININSYNKLEKVKDDKIIRKLLAKFKK